MSLLNSVVFYEKSYIIYVRYAISYYEMFVDILVKAINIFLIIIVSTRYNFSVLVGI